MCHVSACPAISLPLAWLCLRSLSVTKWVHLNWGDKGLINLFRKIYSALRQVSRQLCRAQT